ncbi:hypothetical protein AMS68_000494 [Peltaster fructicola]|uniref:BTB domain-containing protein n=1 Tax=Peltaster fructicola TaxID=286661 RepID=A0A6H0XJS0_9PEZI|nr:hypothetical protein AMS68_000494 [Peltaster fructicola]
MTSNAAEERTVTTKHNIEKALYQENQDIKAGRLKDENPLDTSAEFRSLCEACRRGDLRAAQEHISEGININSRDQYDYTPLILASLCGHFELVQMLLEQGAKCERDTFQGERCLYNALNDRIRNLLLSYDYSKSTDPLQPLAAHITSLLTRTTPQTADIVLHTTDVSFSLQKFMLSARSPYFHKKLRDKPDTRSWKLSPQIPTDSFECCVRYLYFGEASIPAQDTDEQEKAVLEGVDKLSRQLEIPQVFESVLHPGDRRQARQRRQDEIERGRDQISEWFEAHVLRKKIVVPADEAESIVWKRDNGSFADVLLLANLNAAGDDVSNAAADTGIPIGPLQDMARRRQRKVLYPAHRAMLLRSEVFALMFTSPFREGQIASASLPDATNAQSTSELPVEALQIIPVECSPAVLEIILTFLYTEKAEFNLDLALDVLHAADMLFIEKLKQRAALLISTLGNGTQSIVETQNPRGEINAATDQPLDWIYEVVRSGWDCRVQRLEEFGARYIAYRLESYIDDEEFKDLVRESAARISKRQETDTVEIVDDIRYYLSERFRLRFEDAGLEEMMDEQAEVTAAYQDIEGKPTLEDEGYGGSPASGRQTHATEHEIHAEGVIRTLDGEVAGDEFAQDSINYQILLGKIDTLLDELKLDA